MPTVFTKIINGEVPGRFVYRDDQVVAFLTHAPIREGHTLVVPIEEVDHWLDMPQQLAERVMAVGQIVGRAIQEAFNPIKVGVVVAGLEVPHVHYHLVPIQKLSDLDFNQQNDKVSQQELDGAAEKIKAALRNQGHGEFVK